ncbi:MAG TPA: hypothetical protein VF981_12755 [Gemmatimonadaceae bacterium]
MPIPFERLPRFDDTDDSGANALDQSSRADELADVEDLELERATPSGEVDDEEELLLGSSAGVDEFREDDFAADDEEIDERGASGFGFGDPPE